MDRTPRTPWKTAIQNNICIKQLGRKYSETDKHLFSEMLFSEIKQILYMYKYKYIIHLTFKTKQLKFTIKKLTNKFYLTNCYIFPKFNINYTKLSLHLTCKYKNFPYITRFQ